MPIRFSELPKDAGNGHIVDPGQYIAVVEKAEMKAPKDPSKPEYMNLQLQLQTKEGEKIATVFDMMFDPEAYTAPTLAYKLMCFMTACGITDGEWELRDLAKIVVGKKVLVNIKTGKDNNDNDRNEVDTFKNPCYAPYGVAPNDGFINIPEGVEEEGLPWPNTAVPAAESDSNY